MISFDEFLKQDEEDKYNMLQECNAIIQQKENIIKEVRELLNQEWYSVLRKETITKVKEILDKESVE